jgi:protocatechuate 3,4-dioxygenase beta subunit
MKFTRRQTLGIAGAAGGAYLVGSGRGGGPLRDLLGAGAEDAAAQTPNCVLTPNKTEGPYFVDELLNRSDIRDGQAGVPLDLTINVLRADASCTPVEGAVVDIWHCNADGLYSDVAQSGTVGQKFLRGYQLTDDNGAARFLTIFPGWYTGRAIHIHFKIRTVSGNTLTSEFTSQLFFDEAVIAQVVAQSPYNGTPDTSNAADGIYGSDGAQLTPALTGSAASGYAGTVNVGLSGLPDSGGGTAPDTAAQASLSSARFTRNASGKRILKVKLDVDESLSADARLLRRKRVLARKRVADLDPGTRTLRLKVGNRIRGGAARLRIALIDGGGNTKVIRRKLRVPRR